MKKNMAPVVIGNISPRRSRLTFLSAGRWDRHSNVGIPVDFMFVNVMFVGEQVNTMNTLNTYKSAMFVSKIADKTMAKLEFETN